ncbi:polymerase/histidinol phosphatase-like [Heracleum sosnowskyi]|uniref:Polymerase/histidinol phosphatase-like n=1 Tax=Heracleum sosnowskyi TaxID=360622 RepID=A0AAD8J095_9APIA|nr:polymerase/histidinol phosphatase-like [Heracleum sosnowskyi]
MSFLDLNIPYLESTKPTSTNSIQKATRLKLIVKAMELGYTGIAYNRTIKGVMSESDRCSISLFPLSSLLKVSPCLLSSVEFHRSVLGVSKTTPFRQYTRLTVVVDSAGQAAPLNSGNPILKTYDIVAVRPVNQLAFEQACRTCEVDLIAIDFSEKLPFRLKQPLVKAAVERGVCFEITYSSLIMDAQARRQMISSAKLLVDWTKAISKNCRSLIADSIRKKKFYKEAIKVELVTKDPEFDEWLKWDPISSGEGDLLIDEMAKSFNTFSKESVKAKAIDFVSVIDSLPANGLQIKDMVPITKPAVDPLNSGNNLSSVKKNLELVDAPSAPKADQTSAGDQSSDSTNLKKLSDESLKGFAEVSSGLDAAISNHGHELNSVQLQTCTSICETRVLLEVDTLEGHDMQPEREMPTCQTKYHDEAATINTHSKEEEIAKDCNALADTQASTMLVDTQASTMLVDNNLSSLQSEQCKQSSSLDIVSSMQDVVMDDSPNEKDIKVNVGDTIEAFTVSKDNSSACASEVCLRVNNTDAVLASPDEVSLDADMKYKPDLYIDPDLSLHECTMIREQVKITGDGGAVSILDESSILDSCDSSLAGNPIADAPVEEQKQIENQNGTEHHVSDSSHLGTRRKRGKTSRSMFPFRRLWNPIQFKKKSRTSKRKIVTRGCITYGAGYKLLLMRNSQVVLF